MKRILIAAAACLPVLAQAQPTFHPSGANLTYGVNSVSQSAITSANNPAAGALALKKGDTRFRMGLITAGVGYEVGDVDNFVDDLDLIIDKVDTMTPQEAQAVANNDPGNLLEQFNNILPTASQDGYFNTTVGGHVPLTPLLVAADFLGGALSLDASVGMQARVGVLDDAVIYFDGGTPVDYTDDDLDAGDTSLYVKGALVTELALGYSRQLIKNSDGGLYAGVRAKWLSVELGRDNILVDSPATEDLDTALEDFDENTVESSAGTLDLGLIWASTHYQAGLTVMNATSPSFDFPDSSTFTDAPNCGARATLAAQNRCTEALGDTTYKMDAQMRLEGALHSESRSWLVTLAYDVNAVENPVGDDQQWMVAAVAFQPESWIIPAIRAGYRKNMAGTELSYATFGLSLFKGLNLDVAYGLESTEVDGSETPRGAMANLALELRF